MDGANPSTGHAASAPVHDSATSQSPADGRHVVVDVANMQLMQHGETESHCSVPWTMPSPQVATHKDTFCQTEGIFQLKMRRSYRSKRSMVRQAKSGKIC